MENPLLVQVTGRLIGNYGRAILGVRLLQVKNLSGVRSAGDAIDCSLLSIISIDQRGI